MSLYKNSQVAKIYNVSASTVSLWIQNSLKKENNLQLAQDDKGKWHILENASNHAEILRLVELGKKYRSNIICKRVKVSDEIYQIYTEEEIAEIMSDLEFKRQFKLKYSFKKSAYWDNYYLNSESPVNSSVKDLMAGINYELEHFLQGSDSINIVDIGPGNGRPLKDLIQNFYDKNILRRYVCIDISEDINTLATKNIASWFPSLEIKQYVRDIEAARLGKLLLESKLLDRKTTNITFHLGGTIVNHDDRVMVLKNIRNGMVDNDMLVFNFSLNTTFHKSNINYIRALNIEWPLSLLGIDVGDCEVITEYSEKEESKTKMIELDKDYQLEFELFGQKRIIELFSGEKINTFRHKLISLPTLLKELDMADLRLVYLKLDRDLNSALVICKINATNRFFN